MKSVLSVDVAKGKSMIMLSTEYGEVLIEPKEIKHNFRDFNELKDKIESFNLEDLTIFMESTGIYHLPVERYFKENNFNTTIIRKNTVSADKTSKTNSNNNSAPASANKKTTSLTNKNQKINKPKVKRAVIKKISKTSKKKQLKIKWKKLKNVTGYQIKCGLNKKMTKGKKVCLTKINCKSKIIKGLKSKKKYYVKIRAYKTYKSQNGKILKAYGKWSKIKKAITR